MESALTIKPPSDVAISSASADLPLAVGPAMRITFDTLPVAPFSARRIAQHVLRGNADFAPGPPGGDRRSCAKGGALSAAWPPGGLAASRRSRRYCVPG